VQRVATRVFVIASMVFGVVGILFAVTLPFEGDAVASDANHALFVMLAALGFVVLSSFAVSVAGKYLADDGEGASGRR
jgi:hypothetical protein